MVAEMKLSILNVQIKTLQTIFESIKDLVIHTVNLEFTRDGMSLMCMDGTRNAMVHLSLEAGGFMMYSCDETRSIGIRISDILFAIKACRNSAELQMHIPANETTLYFRGIPQEGQKHVTISLQSLDADAERYNIPPCTWRQMVKMNTKDLKDIIRTFDFTDMLHIKWANELLTFSGQEDNKYAEIVVNTQIEPQEDAGAQTHASTPPSAPLASASPMGNPAILGTPAFPSVPELPSWNALQEGTNRAQAGTSNPIATAHPTHMPPVEAEYGIKYLKWITKNEPLGGGQVHLMLEPDFPLAMTYNIMHWGQLTFLVNASVPDEMDENDYIPMECDSGPMPFD